MDHLPISVSSSSPIQAQGCWTAVGDVAEPEVKERKRFFRNFKFKITKLLRWENPSKIIRSNYYPSTARVTTKPCPQVLHLHIF